ncbi:MAG: type VI secretion system ImpA family N-terminal domain-containing protein [Pseudomonadota bacterium]
MGSGSVNADPFLRPIDGANPSGVELKHLPGFLAVDAMVQPATRQNRVDSNGDLNASAPVDWAKVVSEAEKLAATGWDLRLLVLVTRAWTNQSRFAGLAAGCEMISDALLAQWDSIHPELRDRPDKAMAAKGREGAIRDMENREDGVLGDLEMNVVLEPRGFGAIRGGELAQAALSDYEFMQIGTGGMSADEKAAHSASHAQLQARVQTALMATRDEATDALEELAGQIDAANEARAALEAAYAKAGGFENGGGVRLGDLDTFLTRCRKALDLVGDAPAEASAPTGGEAMSQNTSQPAAASAVAGGGGAMPGQLASRRDVEKCLDLIIEFYERTEPSSPIPHLASRMRRMVPMDFMQLIEEVAPGGLKDFKNVAGVDDKKRND